MKTWKKALSCVLALVMVVCLFPVTALAAAPVTSNLQSAIDRANSGDTIVLGANITESITIPANKEITLDLGGYTLTNIADQHTITNNGTLTITGSGTVDNVSHAKGALYNNSGAVCTILSGNFTRSQETGIDADHSGGNSWYVIKNFGSLTIGSESGDNSGIKVEANGKYSSLLTNGWQSGGTAGDPGKEPAVMKDGAQLTIYGGTYSGGLNTIKNDDYGVLTINGGTFQNIAQYAVMNWNEATITGGTFASDYFAIANCGNANNSMDKGILNISGGVFTGASGAVGISSGADLPKVTGGMFSSSVAAFVDPSLNYEANNNGMYTYHTKLSDAQAAAGANGSVRQINGSSGGETTYTITFNDGTVEWNYYLAEGETITLDTPKRSGYYFLGWSDGSKVYQGGATYTVTGNATLTARWASIPGTIIAGEIVNGLASQVQSPFVDVTTMDYYYDAVNWAVEEGITTGTGRYTFSPDEACTRAQAVTFLWRAAGSPAPKSTSTPFVDVDSSAYYYKAVLWAVENGITVGTSATTFSPSETCTRAQIVTFLYRAFGRTTSASTSFTDVAADAYYAPAVAWAAANSITGGTGGGKFSPAATCTRAQIVTFLYRCCG